MSTLSVGTEAMADSVYVGRLRHPGRMIAWQILTIGIYGRVWLYKLLREFDGHLTLILDRRSSLFLLILPFIGPLIVKFRVLRYAKRTLTHDVTGRPLQLGALRAWAFLPIAPVFHVLVQRSLNHHWKMHTKILELELRKQQLEELRKRGRSAAAQQQIREMEKDVQQRSREIDDLTRAAAALREAERVRREAERELGMRTRRGMLGRVKELTARRRKGKDESTPKEQAPPAPPPRKPKKAAEPEPDVAEGAEEPKPKKPFFGFLKRAPKETGEEPSRRGEGKELSRAERKELKRKAKEQRRAAKAAAKEEKRKAKEAAKEAKRKAKEEARAGKAAAKAKAKAGDSKKAKGKPGKPKAAKKR